MKMPPKLGKTNIDDICGLSPVQEGMLYHYLKTPDESAYVVRLLLSFNANIDPVVCEAAWKFVVLNNEILRTVFRWEGIKTPVQIVLKTNDFALCHQELDGSVSASGITSYLETASLQEINLTETPFRIALYTVAPMESYMVIGHHHILYDGWSTGILVNEFLDAYHHLTNDSIPQLIPKPSVKSFTEAIKKKFDQEGKVFWSNYLQGYTPTVVVSQSNDPSITGKSYNEYNTLLPVGIMEKIAAYAQQKGVTSSTILYAAWGLLLLKQSDTRDTIFGTTVSGRSLPLRNIEHTVGLFINTLPLRIKSQDDESIEHIILKISNHLQERESFANYPLAELKPMTLCSPEDDLFSTLVVIENYPLDMAKMNKGRKLQVESFIAKENTHYDLTLSIRLFDTSELCFSYNTARWADTTVLRLKEQLVRILSTIVNRPGLTYGELEIISAEEKVILLGKVGDTTPCYSTTDTVVSLFEKQAKLTPSNTAVRFGKTALTYEQLQQKVYSIAAWLQVEYAVVPGDRIGVLRNRDEYLVPLLLAILKAGASYVPIDPSTQADVIDIIVKNADLKLLITDANYFEPTWKVTAIIMFADEQWQIMSRFSQQPTVYAVERAPVACILYTFEEKGSYDGEIISHQSITNCLTWMQREFGLIHSDVMLQKASLMSGTSIWELFWWSLSGASLYLMESGVEKDPAIIAEIIAKNVITTLHLEPDLCHEVLDTKEYLGTSIRRIYIDAIGMKYKQVQAFGKILNSRSCVRFISMYQPVKTALPTAFYEYKKENELAYVPIGDPVSNTHLYVLGSKKQLLPIGTSGELYLSGPSIGSGYWQNEALTKQKFVSNPFVEGQLMYRTGSRVQWREERTIEYLGHVSSHTEKEIPLVTDSKGTMYVLPLERAEHELVAMWAEVLHLPANSISVTKNFFELGGHSLRATILINRIAKAFNVKIPYSIFFKYATIRQLAALIAQLNKEEHNAIQKAAIKDYYPMSSAQRRLYFLYALNPRSVVYNMSYAIQMKGKLDRERVSNAFRKLIERHEALRTFFEEVHDEPVQRVAPQVVFDISYQTLLTTEVAAAVAAFRQPFNIHVAPLLRIGIIETGSEEYVLMVDMHHIISDGVSRNIIIKDFISFYDQQVLAPLRLQYKDYAVWQKDQLLHKLTDKQRQFWLKEFIDIPITPEIPTDFRRPPLKSYDGNRLYFRIGETETLMLRKLAEAEGTTMFVLLLAIYTIFISKLTGLDDLVIGTPVAARRHSDLEDIVGMFVNTLPLRNQPNGALHFREFLQTVKERNFDCLDNQEYPYEELLNELHIERDASRNPLFDVLFVYEDDYFSQLEIPGLQTKELDNHHCTAKFDLTLTVLESTTGLLMDFEYSTVLFKESTIKRFIVYLNNILTTIIEDNNIQIGKIGVMSIAEKKGLLQALDYTSVTYPEAATVIGLFEKQARLTPDAVALKYGTQILTYGALLQQTNLLASRLRRSGVMPNTIVSLLMDRSIDTVIGMLAILKAGGAYLPIDIDYPKERIHYMLTDSATSLILTAKRFGDIEHYEIPVIYIDDENNQDVLFSDLPEVNRPDDLCYIIYTSGTTGSPKGVMIEHRNVVRLFFNDQFQFHFSAADTWTMFHSHCFDFSVWEMYGALLFGGRLIIIPKMEAQDTSRYLQILVEEKVTVLNQTPSAFYSLAQEAMARPHLSLALRYVIFGGEKLHPGKLEAWHNTYPEVELINMFGITETTVHVTHKKITSADIVNNISNIGKPIPTLSVYICDKYQQIVAPGVSGELLIGGEGLARGYLNKPELTKEKFVPHFFLPGERLYRSGDLVKLLPDGDIVYLGRIDEQIKIRGFRIELGEIESNIAAYSGVQEAAVVVWERNDDKYLAAYYVSAKDIPPMVLKHFLSSKLPEYMVPAHYIRVEKIPITSNNKLNRKALPEPMLREVEEGARPKNQVQRELVKIWVEVLGVAENKIGLITNFFDVGGSSLMLVKMVNKVNAHFKTDIGVAQAFAYPDIASLAELIIKNEDSKADEVLPQTLYDLEQMSNTIDLFNRIQE